MTMKAIAYVLAGCIGGLAGSADAQSLMINASAVGGLQHAHTPYLVSSDLQTFTVTTPTVSLHDYSAITMRFSAPPGYAWHVQNPWPGAGTGNNLRCVFDFGSEPTDASGRRWDYEFDFTPGMGDVAHSTGSGWVSYTGLGFSGGFSFSGDVEFTAMSITLYAAPGHDVLPLDSFRDASLGFEVTGAVPYADPGPHAFLVAVPEPGAGALMALAGVVWIGKRRAV